MGERTRLGDVASVFPGFAFKSADFLDAPGTARLLRGDNIGQGTLRWGGAKWIGNVEPAIHPYTLRLGDVVLAMDRPWVSAGLKFSAVRDSDLPALLVQRVARLRGSDRLDQGFLGHLIGSAQFTEHVLSVQTGTAVPHISARQIEDFSFLLPDLATQRGIAEVLGALDDKIAANTRLAATADELAGAIVREAVDPSRTVRLESLASITMGSSPTGSTLNEDGEGTVFYQGVRDFGTRFPSRRVWTTSPTRIADEGDILVSVRAPVGEVNVANERICVGRGLAAVRSKTNRQHTLFHLLRHVPEAWAPYEAEGTVFGSINRAQLHGILLPEISSDRDEDQLESQIGALEMRIGLALRETEALKKTRDTLLPQLMSGTLRVREAAEMAGL